ncbi:MAG: hypothetical protein RI922_1605 [Bacteroidota bacterium]|jgi:hypothetical protein
MRTNFLTLFFIGISLFNFAQLSTSPYSSYGLGEKGNMDHATFTGLGNSAITYFDSTVLNFYNPSTYNTLAQGQPIYSVGLSSRVSFYNQGDLKKINSTAYFDHFAMAFTLKKHFGLAFGLKPYTRKGYAVYDRVKAGTDSVKYSYIGSGNTSELFLGLSTNLIKYRNHTLSVGANLGYLFGTSTNERQSVLISTASTAIGGVDYNQLHVKSFHYDLGAFYQYILKEKHTFTLAATVEPSQRISATKDEYLYYGAIATPSSYDTLYANPDQKGHIQLATNYTLGFNYMLKLNDARKNHSIRNSTIAFHATYNATDWSNYSTSFDTATNLLSTSKLTFGVQYTPEASFLENSNQSSFLERMRYRAGFYQYTLPYAIQGKQISDQAITLGFGFPILSQRSASSINFGLSYGKRGSGYDTDLNEKYIGINFGLSIAPSNADRWFRKRKLD